ncbi:MAG TPA: FAD-dependent oxidoreductase [Anaerolineales bacterium]|nr:FAD-dependent oxidoreductase [Anaerolineales bacterium]
MLTESEIDRYLNLLQKGLQSQPSKPAKVLIVGAGMAGLAAADILLNAGHDPLILEAQTRVGGRILTVREPFVDGLYAEAGAMRLPRSHRLTLAYVDRFGLQTNPFTMDSPQAYYYFNGRRQRIADVRVDPGLLLFELSLEEAGRSAADLWNQALDPLRLMLREQGQGAWEAIAVDYDQYSVREFLELNRWSEGAIEMFGLLFNQEAIMNSSFMELLREELGDYYTDMVQIEGGMDRLPRAFLPHLRDRIRFGRRLAAVDQTPDEVVLHLRTAGGREEVRGDFAILTLPTTALRHVEVLKPFAHRKQRAIRQLHYDASAKIFIQFGRRFWETDDGIFGGGSITDLAVRNVYYPEHGRETGRGVVLASYTWGEDAQRWGSLAPHDRLEQALENVTAIHPQAAEAYEGGYSKMWHDDEFAGGAFALFDPGQQTLLHKHLIAPEGRIHFAGEHASLGHAWIQGAIESGLRAAEEIHARTAD